MASSPPQPDAGDGDVFFEIYGGIGIFEDKTKMRRNTPKIIFRDLQIGDFLRLHKMYDTFSDDKIRPFFDLYWLGLKRKTIKWFFAQFPLFLSTIKLFRNMLFLFYPYLIFISKVATEGGKIISYSFLIIRKRYDKKYFSAELGIAVIDDYQGKGIGTEMMKRLIKKAKNEKIKEIFLTTRVDNKKARSLYRKFGFKEESILKDEVEWYGRKFDMYKMSLLLSNGNNNS